MTDASTTQSPDDAHTETTDQLVFQNPVDRFPVVEAPKQDQPEPGLDADLEPKTDRGEFSYRGTGRLQGRRALITGADSGIGAAVAIAFAREGASVALNYLPDEEEDAQWVKGVIEKSGGTVALFPGDLTDRSFCEGLPDKAADALGGSTPWGTTPESRSRRRASRTSPTSSSRTPSR